ncbi:unannotated protein [freshwater metagenome]
MFFVENGTPVIHAHGRHAQFASTLKNFGACVLRRIGAHPFIELMAICRAGRRHDVTRFNKVGPFNEVKKRLGVLGPIRIKANPSIGTRVDRWGFH